MLVRLVVTLVQGENHDAGGSDTDDGQQACEHAAIGRAAVGKEPACLPVPFHPVQVLQRTLRITISLGGLEIRQEIDLMRNSRQKLHPLFMILDISNACPKDKPVNRSIM